MKLNFRAFQGLSQAYITSIPHLRLHVLWTAMEYCGYPNSPGTLPFFSSHHPLETFLWTFWICLLKVWSTWLTMLRVFILKTQILRCHAYFPIMFNSSLLTRIGCRNMVFLWLLGDKTHQQITNSSAELLSASYIYQLYSRWLKVYIFLKHPLNWFCYLC